MMTACDVSAITKPWPIQQTVSDIMLNKKIISKRLTRNVQLFYIICSFQYSMSIINAVGGDFSPGLQHNSIIFLRITFQVAKLVASEFFEQGDIERDKLKSEPMVRFLI